jgi:hypothetical protein
VLFSLSASVTYVRTDIMELYRAMGISADQLRVIEPMPMGPNYFFGFTLLSLVIYVALLLIGRRHFRTNTAAVQ